MNRIAWTESALFDLEELADQYDLHRSGLGDEMIERLHKAALPLIDNPRMGPSAGMQGYRKWPAKGTTFLMLYRVEGNIIYIVRVVHSASDWQSII